MRRELQAIKELAQIRARLLEEHGVYRSDLLAEKQLLDDQATLAEIPHRRVVKRRSWQG